MTDGILIDNWREEAYIIRSTKLADKKQLQHIRLDFGSGTSESQVTLANPFPVTVVSGGGGITTSNANSGGVAQSLIVKASAGALYTISGYNNGTSDLYIHVFNSASIPADGATPLFIINAYAGQTFGYECSVGRQFSTGIAICASTTAITKTITTGTALTIFDCQYT